MIGFHKRRVSIFLGQHDISSRWRDLKGRYEHVQFAI